MSKLIFLNPVVFTAGLKAAFKFNFRSLVKSWIIDQFHQQNDTAAVSVQTPAASQKPHCWAGSGNQIRSKGGLQNKEKSSSLAPS